MYYILKDKIPVKVNNAIAWAMGMKNIDSIVEQTKLKGVRISTVFLGINHRYGDGDPLLFETMIFGGEHDEYQTRYSTWDEALEGHKKACNLVLTKLN